MGQNRFAVSKTEINRRVIAFTSLALTWPIATACGSMLLQADKRTPALLLSAGILVAMLVIGALTIPFLRRSHMHTVYELEGNILKRKVGPGVKEAIDLTRVKHIHVKYTSHGPIRQITLTEANGRRHSLDGAEQFELLHDRIVTECPTAHVSAWREPMNYDHGAFYPALGVMLGVMSTLAVALMSSSGTQTIRITIACIIVFVFAVAAYIATTTPLARQYGSQEKKSDWALASLLAVAAILVGAVAVIIL